MYKGKKTIFEKQRKKFIERYILNAQLDNYLFNNLLQTIFVLFKIWFKKGKSSHQFITVIIRAKRKLENKTILGDEDEDRNFFE